MTLSGLRSRALCISCAYGVAIIAFVGVAVGSVMALSPAQTRSDAVAPVGKIGPGYARMRPIDMGKAEKVIFTTPYSIPIIHVAATKRRVRLIDTVPAETAPPVVIAVALRSNTAADLHRIY